MYAVYFVADLLQLGIVLQVVVAIRQPEVDWLITTE